MAALLKRMGHYDAVPDLWPPSPTVSLYLDELDRVEAWFKVSTATAPTRVAAAESTMRACQPGVQPGGDGGPRLAGVQTQSGLAGRRERLGSGSWTQCVFG